MACNSAIDVMLKEEDLEEGRLSKHIAEVAELHIITEGMKVSGRSCASGVQ